MNVRWLCLLLVVGIALPAAVLAAEPPLTQEELEEDSSDIVVAEAVQVFTALRDKGEDYVDRLYCIQLRVLETVKQGDQPLSLAYVHAWQPETRPDGWAGSQGQNDLPARGEVGHFYVTRKNSGQLHLLGPNGYHPATHLDGEIQVKAVGPELTLVFKPVDSDRTLVLDATHDEVSAYLKSRVRIAGVIQDTTSGRSLKPYLITKLDK